MKESHIYKIHVEMSSHFVSITSNRGGFGFLPQVLLFQFEMLPSHYSDSSFLFWFLSCSWLPYIYDPVMNSESSVFYSQLVSFNYAAQSSVRGALRSVWNVTTWLCDGWFFLAVLLFQFHRPSEITADKCCLTSQQRGGNEP